ncbi:MAG: thiamine phosphate synthase [Cellvibrionaceae bacterium]|nr:thiamine phosphate synthase [Cellvibrionaceae bacterium]
MNRFGPLYAITDPLLLPGDRLYEAVAQALAAGVKLVQLRDKTASDEQLTQQARRLVALCNEWKAFCVINDRVDIALASEAQGVHLGQGDGSAAKARQVLGDRAIIGVTCHSDLTLARRAQEEGASYVAFGRFFSSNTKPLAGAATLDVLQQAAAEIALPVVAIGGIRADNMAPLIQAGAQTLAVCHSLFGHEDTASAAATLMAAYQQCRAPTPRPNHQLYPADL